MSDCLKSRNLKCPLCACFVGVRGTRAPSSNRSHAIAKMKLNALISCKLTASSMAVQTCHVCSLIDEPAYLRVCVPHVPRTQKNPNYSVRISVVMHPLSSIVDCKLAEECSQFTSPHEFYCYLPDRVAQSSQIRSPSQKIHSSVERNSPLRFR